MTETDVLAQMWPDLKATIHEAMGVVISEASPARIVGTMPVEGNTQYFGMLHGGASCVLAESLGSIGSSMHAHEFGMIAVGVDINATHHRAVTSGTVTGVATPIRLGRSVTSYEVVISDDRGRRVCTARLTCNLVNPAGRT